MQQHYCICQNNFHKYYFVQTSLTELKAQYMKPVLRTHNTYHLDASITCIHRY
jgi:hypothetical protein